MQEVLTTWVEVNFEDRIMSVNHFLGQNLWNNLLIRIGNCPVFYSDWNSVSVKILSVKKASRLVYSELYFKKIHTSYSGYK